MIKDFIPGRDHLLEAWLVNFVAVATANLATLNLTAADLSGVSGGATDLGARLDTIVANKGTLAASISDKNSIAAGAISDARTLAKRIQATANVPDSLKAALGITVPSSSRARITPVQPASLLATPNADGTNALKWNKATNKQATIYQVLAKPITPGAIDLSDTGWVMVGSSTRPQFTHQNVTPGVPMAYKVQATRAGLVSAASLPATVYTS